MLHPGRETAFFSGIRGITASGAVPGQQVCQGVGRRRGGKMGQVPRGVQIEVEARSNGMTICRG